ncbi:MAG: hypothetical protein U0103_08360 [Candidatus Obscuribacterales bacterium]
MTVHARLEYQSGKGDKQQHLDSSEAFRSQLISDPNRTGRHDHQLYDATSFNNTNTPLYDTHKLYGGTTAGAPQAQEAAVKKDKCTYRTQADVDNQDDFMTRRGVMMAYASQQFAQKVGAFDLLKWAAGCDKKD